MHWGDDDKRALILTFHTMAERGSRACKVAEFARLSGKQATFRAISEKYHTISASERDIILGELRGKGLV